MSRLRPSDLFLFGLRAAALPLTAGIALALLSAAANAGLFATSGFLIGAALLMPSVAELQVAIVGVRLLGLLRGGLRYLERVTAHAGAFPFVFRVREEMLDALGRSPGAWLRSFSSGDLIARFASDADALQEWPLRAILPLAAGIPLSAAAVSLAATAGAPPALLAGWTALYLVSALAGLWSLVRAHPAPARSRLAAQTGNAVLGLPELLVADGGRRSLALILREAARMEDRQVRHRAAASSSQFLFSMLHGLFLILVAGAAASSGNPAAAAAAACFAIAAQEFLGSPPAAFTALGGSLAAADRIRDAILAAAEPRPAASAAVPAWDPSAHAVEFERVTYTYPGAVFPALDAASFRIPAGAHALLAGPSGSGKSTVLHLLLRLTDGYRGEIRSQGVSLSDAPVEESRAQFSAMLAQPMLLSASLSENLRFGGPAPSADAVRSVLEELRLAERFPPALWNAPLEDPDASLSAGEIRRIVLARALLHPAPVLLLDEPAENLDTDTADAVMDAVLRRSAGRTLICITHSNRGRSRFNYFVELREGRTTREETR